jgi:CRISPR-associated endonuclease/helicase Cas3
MNTILEKFTLNEVFAQALAGRQPYPHQLKTAKKLLEGKSVVLRAPCGSGKTEACYVSLILGRDSCLPDRLIYSLPTRALVEDVTSRIKKGMSRIGLPPIVSPQHGANSEDPFFKSEIVVATIDQTIGAYCCTPLSLPAHLGNIPAGAAVSSFLCFDEAHVYDHLLGLQSVLVLVERTTNLELPFLIMSATLPDSFIEWFRENEVFSDKIAIVEGKDKDVPKRQNRCVILKWKDKLLEHKDVLDCAESWRRIMVVCNTVDRAQKLYESIKKPLKHRGFNVFLLHSRFLDTDRERIEKNMKTCLEDPERKTCLITTQVCEVGLDISCDLLLTELAPPDSLIQRMGRCAREGGRGEVWVFKVEYYAPYGNEDMEKSRNYISERLDGKRIGWNEELEFVNTLLGEKFERIMNDKSRRNKILLSLGDAAFKGSKQGIERNVREVLSANLTIHDDPNELDYSEILHMPWINVDIRVLRRPLEKTKYWQINFTHDEHGKPKFYSKQNAELYPYEYYIVHPDYVKYDSDMGLILDRKGKSLKTFNLISKPKLRYEYPNEEWEKHVEKCLTAFSHIKVTEGRALKLLAKIINCELGKTEGLIALSLVVHDLGKLNKEWQKKVGIKTNHIPLAHIPLERKIGIPHATVSAYATHQLFVNLLEKRLYAVAFKLAIGHHHHTRAEHVPPYSLGWQKLYETLIRKTCEKYELSISGSVQNNLPVPTKLNVSFLDIEKRKLYTIYCIVARFIRLCDQASFSVK